MDSIDTQPADLSIFTQCFTQEYNFYVAKLPEVQGTSFLGMCRDCMDAGSGVWTQVAKVGGEAANHLTNGASDML